MLKVLFHNEDVNAMNIYAHKNTQAHFLRDFKPEEKDRQQKFTCRQNKKYNKKLFGYIKLKKKWVNC